MHYILLCIFLFIVFTAVVVYVKSRCFPSKVRIRLSDKIDSSIKAVYTVCENTLGFYQLNIVSSSLNNSTSSILYRGIDSSSSLLSWNNETKEIYICCAEGHFAHNQLVVYSISLNTKNKKRVDSVVADEIKISNDGLSLFYIQRDTFHLIFKMDLQNNSVTQLTKPKESLEIDCWDIASDGSFVVFKTNEKKDGEKEDVSYLYRITDDGSKIIRIAEQTSEFPIHYVAVSPNSEMILTGDNFRIYLSNCWGENRKCIKRIQKDSKIDNVFWGPDNNTVCFECYDECFLHLFNIKGEKCIRSFPFIGSRCLFIPKDLL